MFRENQTVSSKQNAPVTTSSLRTHAEPEEVSIALFNGTAVITTDQHKRALIKSSQELQLRQDELKEDFSEVIVQRLKALCQNVLNDVLPQKEPPTQGYFEKRLKPSSTKPDSSSVT